jgi:hypothetical protein
VSLLRLRQITAVGSNQYEGLFDGDEGETERVVFTVFEDRDVTSIQPEPDIFMQGRALAREVASAVLAYHRREEGSRHTEVADGRPPSDVS